MMRIRPRLPVHAAQRGRTGAVRPAYAAPYGVGQVPYQADIKQIVDAFNALPCFKSRQILPAVVSAQRFAKDVMPSFLSTLQAGGDYIATERRLLDQRWYTLEYWRNRLATEPEKTYCQGTTDGVQSTDRQQIQDAVVGPYIEASGVSGAEAVLSEARRQLLSDLTLGISEGKPPWYLDIKWLGPIFVAAVAIGIYSRVKGTGAKHEPSPAPSPEAPAPLPPEQQAAGTTPPDEEVDYDEFVKGGRSTLPPSTASRSSFSRGSVRP